MKPIRLIVLAGLTALAATPALAHPGHDHAAGFAAGAAHPFSGFDHLLAMAAVGLWAAIRGGKAVWAWPLAFLSAMAAGGAFGLGNASLPLVEPVVLASAIILGGLTAAATKAPLAAGAGLVALFGLAHGYAHGLEAPADPAVAYAAGFLLATASLMALGLAVGLGLLRIERPNLLRLLGAAAALCGLAVVLA